MMGLPLVPCHEFPTGAKAAFFSTHALKDPKLVDNLTRAIDSGMLVLLTEGLAEKLAGKVRVDSPNVRMLAIKGKPNTLLGLSQGVLDGIREQLLRPLNRRFEAPNRVALYLFNDGSWVIENFNDEAVQVKLDGEARQVEGRGWIMHWR
jgi:hypothetical protein